MLSNIQFQTCPSQILLCMSDPSDSEPIYREHTSTKLRMAIPRALAYFGRPMSAHEFESWISANEPELALEVSLKCYDYVRMILSLTKPLFLAKYKCKIAPPGNDKRAAFYGIPDGIYSSNWTKVNPPRRKSRRTKRRSMRRTVRAPPPPPASKQKGDEEVPGMIENEESDLFFFDEAKLTDDIPIQPIDGEYVSDEMALACWKKLSTHFEFGNQIWSQLLRALSTAKERSREPKEAREIAQEIASQYSVIRTSEVIDQILLILQREIHINREMSVQLIEISS